MSDVPQKPPFEETEEYQRIVRFFELRFSDIEANLMANLLYRGRTVAKYPDDRDLMHRYASHRQDAQIEKLRALEDGRERYERGDL